MSPRTDLRGKQSSGSLRFARLFGIDIRVHWSFFVLVLLVAWGSDGVRQMVNWLVWIAAVFGCVLVHEIAHCVLARRRGAVVKDILLLPIGGVSQMEKMPEAPADELSIAIAGPLTSLGLGLSAVVVGLVLRDRLWPPTLFAGSWFARLAWLNLLLAAFNMLPALPMDGGRVLRAALSRRRGRSEATRLAGKTARLVAAGLIVVGFFYDLWLVLIGIFVLLGATAEEHSAAQTVPRQGDGSAHGEEHERSHDARPRS